LETRPRADAQPVRVTLVRNSKLVRLPGIAPGPSTWQEDILLLNHSREIKRAGSFTLPAHAISTKNKHLLVIYSIPTRGFTAAVSVFRGTPPAKPLECKFWLNTIGALLCDRWAEPTGGEPRLSRAFFSIVSVDIIEMSPSFRSQIVHLSLLQVAFDHSRKTKNPAYLSVSRVGKIL
jgi:hypothetical protein